MKRVVAPAGLYAVRNFGAGLIRKERIIWMCPLTLDLFTATNQKAFFLWDQTTDSVTDLKTGQQLPSLLDFIEMGEPVV